MPIIHQLIQIPTESGIQIYDVTPQIQTFVTSTTIQNGQVLIFSRHTTTALAINENEPRLFEDVKAYLQQLAPEGELTLGTVRHRYRHNDLHLRPNIPPDEPMNAHSHLMAMTLSTSEVIPVVDGKLALGTYQSVLLFELDGPRTRSLLLQAMGE
ncbi:secondary thiamine-phosphate synthase enzyme [Leptolyngbyaceae cyanobacterium JSC-12]|nr:secondary thiamine-phosphate synthase enzyme [Leptolyngbyaceae cyanobacterium JSC-12]